MPVTPKEGHFISHKRMIRKNVFQNIPYEIHPRGYYFAIRNK